jgi:hypothetical protein
VDFTDHPMPPESVLRDPPEPATAHQVAVIVGDGETLAELATRVRGNPVKIARYNAHQSHALQPGSTVILGPGRT